MLENAPSEAFEPIQGLPDCTPTMQKVFRRADETEVGCYIYPDNMVLFPHGEGLLQFQSWLIREGGWEGEGPVLLSPTLSQEAAKRVGDDLMADLELPHMRLATVEAGRMIESYGYNTIAVGWILTYTRGEGNEVPFDANMVSSKAMIFDDEASYAPPWNQEAIYLLVDEIGVRYFSWRHPVEIVQEVNANVELLPFDTVTSGFARWPSRALPGRTDRARGARISILQGFC